MVKKNLNFRNMSLLLGLWSSCEFGIGASFAQRVYGYMASLMLFGKGWSLE